MDVQSTHRSRRSFPNLQHLSLAPLSSRFPIDGDDYEEAPEEVSTISSSYIQSKTAPTTPSILSRSSSRQRKNKRRSAHNVHDGYFPPELDMSDLAISKAKSAVNLEAQGRRHHLRTPTGTMLTPRTARHGQRRTDGDDEWLHRAGLAIASEMRENKGQSWLVTRDSSTSLVAHTSEYHERHVTMMSGEQFADDEDSPLSPRYSRSHSRVQSRVHSARNSRRGSMVGGSKIGFMTPMDSKTPGSAIDSQGYFDDIDTIAEPDFVEAEDDGIVDDEEVSRLAKQKGIGFGGLVDRLVGFSLFNVDEDAEESEDDDSQETAEEAVKRKQAELKNRRDQLARAAKSSADAMRRGEPIEPSKQGEEGGWQDAAWLLSVASKMLY